MNNYYIIDPEVAGHFGPRTVMDRNVHPPEVTHLHYVFDGWLGDQLVESIGCYVITSSLAHALQQNNVTGFELADVEITKSRQFEELHPNREIPLFRWMRVTGKLGESDVFMTSDHRLGVTRKVLDLLLATQPQDLEFEEVN